MNKIINQLWPYIGEYAKEFLHEYIEPEIRSQMPTPFKNFKFVAIDMGDVPCRVGGIKVFLHYICKMILTLNYSLIHYRCTRKMLGEIEWLLTWMWYMLVMLNLWLKLVVSLEE